MQTTESCQNNCLNSNLPKKVRKKKAVMSVCNSLTSRYGMRYGTPTCVFGFSNLEFKLEISEEIILVLCT